MTPPKVSEVALLPCPWHGVAPKISPPPDSYDAYWHIVCPTCEGDDPPPGCAQDLDEAKRTWNKRAGSEREAAFVEAARAFAAYRKVHQTGRPPTAEERTEAYRLADAFAAAYETLVADE
jgi:hypothetical protein